MRKERSSQTAIRICVPRFECGAREFVNRWSECGPTHHFGAAVGRHIDVILKVAKILNVPVDIVTR